MKNLKGFTKNTTKTSPDSRDSLDSPDCPDSLVCLDSRYKKKGVRGEVKQYSVGLQYESKKFMMLKN